MIHDADKLWNALSVAMAAMIHVSVAAWAASEWPENHRITQQGKPRPLSMEINLAMIETPARPEPVIKKTATVPEAPRVKPQKTIIEKNKTRCFSEPPKPRKTETVKVPEPVRAVSQKAVVDEQAPPVRDIREPVTARAPQVEKAKPEALAPVAPVFPPGMISPLRPRYPRASRLKREEGEVTVWFHVRGDGRAEDIQIVKSSGYSRLDSAASKAVRKHEFIPAEQDQRPMDSLCTLTIRFKIRS